jgi:hypothetical protein
MLLDMFTEPIIENVDPNRAMLRRLTLDPNEMKSKTETEDPKRRNERILRLLPICIKSSTLRPWSRCVEPYPERELPRRANDLTLKEEVADNQSNIEMRLPNLASPCTLKLEPNRLKLRIDRVDPRSTQSNKDIEDPNRPQPKTEKLLPARWYARVDRDEPISNMSRTDMHEPRRTLLQTLAAPPNRANPFRETAEPRVTKSKIDKEEPSLNMPYTLKVLPSLL